MGSSSAYWQHARDCARWAAESKRKSERDLLLEMAKAWTNVALAEADVARQVALECTSEQALHS